MRTGWAVAPPAVRGRTLTVPFSNAGRRRRGAAPDEVRPVLVRVAFVPAAIQSAGFAPARRVR